MAPIKSIRLCSPAFALLGCAFTPRIIFAIKTDGFPQQHRKSDLGDKGAARN